MVDTNEEFDYEITVPEELINKPEQEEVVTLEGSEEVVDTTKETVEETTEEKEEVVVDKQDTPQPKNIEIDLGAPAEKVEQPIEDKSSLTKNKVQEVLNQEVFDYLSESLGRDIKSVDDLKVADNPLESQPYLKELYDWSTRTGRPIEDWVKYQEDPAKMSEEEVARKFLQHKYPEFESEEIDYEMSLMLPNEDDTETESRAKKHSFKKFVMDGRKTLNGLRSQFNEPLPNKYTPEVQADLELLKNIKQQYQSDQEATKQYQTDIKKTSLSMESIPLQLSDDLNINFKLSDKERGELPTFINEMPHWKNEDGSWNHKAIVKDAAVLKNLPQLIKVIFEQGTSYGEEKVLKNSKNVSLDKPTEVAPNKQNKIEIEGGLEAIFGRRF